MQLELSRASLQREVDAAGEEKVQLLDTVENLQAQVGFSEERANSLEQKLIQSGQDLKKVTSELQVSVE